MSFVVPLSRLRNTIAIAGLALIATGGVDAQQPTQGKRYAILIGVKQYFKDQLRELPNAENDMQALAKALEKSGYEKSNILVMTQEIGMRKIDLMPSAGNIRSSLDEWMKKCTANDCLLIAFAGHAVQFDDDQDSYLCPAYARLDGDHRSLISVRKLFQTLRTCPAKQKLLLVDGCRPESIIARPPRRVARGWNPKYRINVRPAEGVAALFSCSQGETAYERSDVKQSVFFHAIAEGIQGKADADNDSTVSLMELATYANAAIPNYVLSAHRSEQTPMFVSELRGDFSIAHLGIPKIEIAGRLANTDRYDARRKESYHKRHLVKWSSDVMYTIDLTSPDFDTYLRIENEYGTEMAADDDGGVGLNSRLSFHPERSGTYRIIVTSYAGKKTGAYTITIAQQAVPSSNDSKVVLSVNRFLSTRDSFDTVFKKSRMQEHIVELENGKYYTFEAQSRQVDMYLRLKSPEGKTLKYDDDSSIGLDSMLTYQPTTSGKYRVIVTTYADHQTGGYMLTVREGVGPFVAANKRIKLESQASSDVSAGWTQYNKDLYTSAMTTADRVLQTMPNYVPALLLKAKVYEKRRDYTRALQLCSDAIRLEPNNDRGYNARGNVYFAKGDEYLSIVDYNQAIKLNPGSAVYLVNRGNAYEANGQDALALADANKALSLRPTYDYVKKLKKVLDNKRVYGNRTGAVEFYNTSNKSINYEVRWKSYRDVWTTWKTSKIAPNNRRWHWMPGAMACEMRVDTDANAGVKRKSFTMKFYRYANGTTIKEGMGRPYRFRWVGNEIWLSEKK